jgi:hypothetical protein
MMRLLVAVLFVGLAAPAAAQPAEQVPTPEALTSVYQCAAVQDATQRLACYDAAVGRLREAETEGRIVAVDREQVETLERESFGFSIPSLASLIPRLGRQGGEPSIERIETQVERIFGGVARYSFVLANGQTWTQVDPQDVRNVRPGDPVTIRRGALGSYFMTTPRGGAAHRVRRAQ